MSINVYLKDEVQQATTGFEEKEKAESGHKRSEYRRVSGTSLLHDKGRWYFILHYLTDQIPDSVKEFVEEISCFETFSSQPKRALGVYKFESVEAELDDWDKGKYQLKMRGKSMENMLKLYRLIRAGQTFPVESYDGQQSGVSRSELEAELEQMQSEMRNLREARGILWGLIIHIGMFTNDKLGKERWPFCTKRRVIREITKILDSRV